MATETRAAETRLPAIVTDGRPLHTKVDPWLLNDLICSYLPRLNAEGPFLSYIQLWISVLLAWWVVPITLVLLWLAYLRRHERLGTIFHVGLLVVGLVAAISFYRLAVKTLTGSKRNAFGWRMLVASRNAYMAGLLTAFLVGVFGLISWGAIRGERSSKPIFSFIGITNLMPAVSNLRLIKLLRFDCSAMKPCRSEEQVYN